MKFIILALAFVFLGRAWSERVDPSAGIPFFGIAFIVAMAGLFSCRGRRFA